MIKIKLEQDVQVPRTPPPEQAQPPGALPLACPSHPRGARSADISCGSASCGRALSEGTHIQDPREDMLSAVNEGGTAHMPTGVWKARTVGKHWENCACAPSRGKWQLCPRAETRPVAV